MKKGKRYWWYFHNERNKIKSGLFTGEYEKNGNAILLTKNGDSWSLPCEILLNKEPRLK